MSARPSVPNKTGAPMVTPGLPKPIVTISMVKNENEAPSDLLPDAQLMDNLRKKQKKKLKKQAQGRPDICSLSGVTITQSNVGAGGGNPNPFNIPPPTWLPSHVPMGVPSGPSSTSMQVS